MRGDTREVDAREEAFVARRVDALQREFVRDVRESEHQLHARDRSNTHWSGAALKSIELEPALAPPPHYYVSASSLWSSSEERQVTLDLRSWKKVKDTFHQYCLLQPCVSNQCGSSVRENHEVRRVVFMSRSSCPPSLLSSL